jgi:Ca2+-binding EF-hand superfamily protein
VQEQVKQIELEIKKRLSANFNSVRKAFLELDQDHRGTIGAEELAKFIGAQKKQNFDFTTLEILVKMRTKGMAPRISYSDFVQWFGSSI